MQKIFKWLILMLIAAVCGLLFFRMYTVGHFPKATTQTVVTDRLAAAYAENGGLNAYTWEIPVNYDDPHEPNFFCAAPVYFESAGTFEITVRCKLKDAAALGFDKDGKTVAVLSDDAGAKVAAVTSDYFEAYGLYAYRRFVFEDIDLANCNYLKLSLYPTADAESAAPLGALAVYEARYPQKEYRLSAKERKQFSQ